MSITIITYVEIKFACIVLLHLFLQYDFKKKCYIVIC